MLQGTIVENSLNNLEILERLNVIKSWPDGNWNLHQVKLSREEALSLARYIAAGPWYMHFWESGKDDVLVVFKDKTFDIKYSDKTTWIEAVKYGESLGIPDEQLDFDID